MPVFVYTFYSVILFITTRFFKGLIMKTSLFRGMVIGLLLVSAGAQASWPTLDYWPAACAATGLAIHHTPAAYSRLKECYKDRSKILTLETAQKVLPALGCLIWLGRNINKGFDFQSPVISGSSGSVLFGTKSSLFQIRYPVALR